MVGYPGPAGVVIPAAMIRGVARSLLPPGRIPAAWSWPTPTCEQALPIGELAYAALEAGCGYVNILGQGLDAQVVAYVAGCLGPVAEELTDVALTRARMGAIDFLGLYARRGDAEAVVLPYHQTPTHLGPLRGRYRRDE